MTPKLIISSLVGVTAVGGVFTGCYYAFNNSNNKELKNKEKEQAKKEEISSKPLATGSQPTTQVQSSEPNNRENTVGQTAPNTLNPNSPKVTPSNGAQPSNV